MSYKFTLTLNNVINTQRNGLGNATFNESNLIIPRANLLTGMPSSLPLLAVTLPAEYITFRYSNKLAGRVFGHTCWRADELKIYAFVKNVHTGGTIRLPPAGEVNLITTPCSPSRSLDDPIMAFSAAKPPIISFEYAGPGVISSLHTFGHCEPCIIKGDLNGCNTCEFGGFEVSISLIIDVTIDMVAYCTKGSNIHNELCYNYMADYLPRYGSNTTIDSYLTSYCSSKFPNKDLSIFNDPNDTGIIDKRDYDICACNMDQKNYDIFLNHLNEKLHTTISLGSIKPNCLFPACLLSHFKNSRLGLPKVGAGPCPVPQCLNIVDMHGNNIIGDVVINQSADCKSYGIGVPPSEKTSPSGPSITPNVITYNTFTYVYIIAGIVLLVIIIIIIIAIFVKKKKK